MITPRTQRFLSAPVSDAMDDLVSLEITHATVDDLADVRAYVATRVAQLGGDDDVSFRLQLAADELCSNALHHGYGTTGPLSVTVDRDDGFILTVTDRAPRFDTTQVTGADTTLSLGDRQPGGMGLHLVHQVADRVTHHTTDDGNITTVTISSTPAEPA